eukprot:jgi/Picsp_1/6469/NSC_03815-R1_---NA---
MKVGSVPQCVESTHVDPQILESLESMLNLYRERCVSQSKQITDMKEQIERMSRELESKRAGYVYRDHFGVLESTKESVARTKRRVHDLAVELEKANSQKREYETRLYHCLELLKSESAWRAAALSWMESDGALHKQIVQDIKARSVAERHDGGDSSQGTCHMRQCDARSCDFVLHKIKKHTKNHEKLIKNTIQSFRQNRK